MATIPCHCLIYQYNLYRLCVCSIQVSDIPGLENECWFERNIKEYKTRERNQMLLYDKAYSIWIKIFSGNLFLLAWNRRKKKRQVSLSVEIWGSHGGEYEIFVLKCITWWRSIDAAEETTAFIFRVDEFTKMHSVLFGEYHHLTLCSLFNKLRNLSDMTWNEYFLETEFLAAYVIHTLPYSVPHYATLHLYSTFFQWRFWKYQHELFLGFYLVLLQQLWHYLVFPWEIWIIRKLF